MQLTRIAWRNLKQNIVRTFIAIVSITIVVIIVVFARGLMVGITESSLAIYIDNKFGHVRITTEEYKLREVLLPLDFTIKGFDGRGAEEMTIEIEEMTRVEHVLPRMRFGAMATIEDVQVRMVGVGVDPARENNYGALSRDILEGRMPEAVNDILVGRGLLEKLGAEVGDSVTLMFSDAYQSLRTRSFDIVGVREVGVAGLDNNYFYMPLKTAQDMLLLEDQVTEMLVFASTAREAHALQADLNTLLKERGEDKYTTVIWNMADPFVEFYNEAASVMDFVYLLIILMGSVVIISNLTMIVRERTPEIGMMAALGLRSREIMKVFILEGAFMGLIVSFLGVVGGGLITFHYSRAGLHVEDFAILSRDLELLIKPTFYLAFSMENLIVSFALGAIVVTLACLYPAFKAARLQPAEALHYIDE